MVGVPEITPVEEPIDRPAGRPVAEYDSVPVAVSSACTCSVTAVPTAVVWLPGLMMETLFALVPVKSPLKVDSSAAHHARVGGDQAELAVVVERVGGEVLRAEERLGSRGAVVGDDRLGVNVEAGRRGVAGHLAAGGVTSLTSEE